MRPDNFDRTQFEEPDDEPVLMSQQAIAKELGISRHKCAYIEEVALKKLKALFIQAGFDADDLMRLE